jgi:carbamoyl-phosphate synthase large subunit
MGSTGEVACFGDTFGEALLLAMQASGMRLPKKNVLVSLGKEENKIKLLPALQVLAKLGLKIYATEGTADFLKEQKIECEKVYKIHSDGKPNILGIIESGKLELIINIPARALSRDVRDGFIIRRKAIDNNIPLITNRQLAEAFIIALSEKR